MSDCDPSIITRYVLECVYLQRDSLLCHLKLSDVQCCSVTVQTDVATNAPGVDLPGVDAIFGHQLQIVQSNKSMIDGNGVMRARTC